MRYTNTDRLQKYRKELEELAKHTDIIICMTAAAEIRGMCDVLRIPGIIFEVYTNDTSLFDARVTTSSGLKEYNLGNKLKNIEYTVIDGFKVATPEQILKDLLRKQSDIQKYATVPLGLNSVALEQVLEWFKRNGWNLSKFRYVLDSDLQLVFDMYRDKMEEHIRRNT